MKTDKLDNPTWYALTETHKDFALDFDGIKFYQPDYCPFGGFTKLDSTEEGIDKYASLTDDFYIVGDRPIFNDQLQLKKELVCNQMVLDKNIDLEITETITELQSTKQKSDLFELVNLVQPGYFKNKTADLGNYYGIYKDDKLIAVTGERMKMKEYTEISAVVTHADHTGKGYAKQLIAHASEKIFIEDKIPYLHVAATNTGAIRLYEILGFKTRRPISFWNLITLKNQ